MATTHAQPGDHVRAARALLQELEPITSAGSGDAQVRATAAVAHAVLALTEQASMIRTVIQRSETPSGG